MLATIGMPTYSAAAPSILSGFVAKASNKTSSPVLPVKIMKLVAYQQGGSEGVGKYLLRHGYKFRGRFIPEDLNPDYYNKAYCNGCSVNKKRRTEGIYTRRQYD